MSDMPKLKMTVDEFLVWAEDQPGRHELVNGRVYAMSPERLRHIRTKASAYNALAEAIRKTKLPCEVFPDGATVRINRATAFEPDALMRCGDRLGDDMIEVPDPVVVIEVLSPSTRNYDAGAKLIGYFAVPSIRHYLMIDPDHRVIVHHRRDGEAIATRIIGSGLIRLDPPGIEVAIEDLLGGPSIAA